MKENNYKESRYNIFVPYKTNETIIYNSLSGAIGKFDDDTLRRFKDNSLTDEELNILKEKGIIVEKSFDELNIINCDRYNGIKSSNLKHYRIWPTSACNARCYYCFEKGIEVKTMTIDIAKDVVEYIDKNLNENDNLKIEWFGGEPLLKQEIIQYIHSALNVICEKKHCYYTAAIISNGSIINKNVADKIAEWNIKLIQITLDGFRNQYNNSKNYYNPKLYNFDKVIDAIKLLADKKIHVTVRMNYDTKNYKSLVKLIKFLHHKFSKYTNISYYVYPLWSSINEEAVDAFLSNAKADKNVLNLYDLLIKNGMGDIKRIARLYYKKNACQAWSENSITILPDGSISKCCESYNQVIGDIWHGITNKQLYDFWVNTEIEDKCSACKFLPLCQGGCKTSHFSRMPQCFALKPIFDDFLKWYVKYLDKTENNSN